ncbi:MAG: hypothetical protein WBB98_04890 [Xanthobacteraceae bacterium]
MSRERTTFKVLGHNIGTATGWDTLDGSDIILYEFVPDSRFHLPRGDLAVMFEKGTFETYDDDGNVTDSQDIVEVLAGSFAEAA